MNLRSAQPDRSRANALKDPRTMTSERATTALTLRARSSRAKGMFRKFGRSLGVARRRVQVPPERRESIRAGLLWSAWDRAMGPRWNRMEDGN